MNYKIPSIFVEEVDKVDSVERIYNDKLNEDCVTYFLTNDDDNDDDDANLITITSTMVSIACTVHCNNIPIYSCNIPQYVINRSDEDLTKQQLAFPLI